MQAIVTGSSRGIGKACALYLARRGHAVVVHGSRENDTLLESFAEVRALCADSICVAADLAEPARIDALFARIQEAYGGIDALVNNAAYLSEEYSLDDLPLETWDRTLGVNLRAPWLCGKQAAAMMKVRGGGRIVNVSSVHDVAPRRGYGHYSAAKAGLVMLTKAMATEWADDNIQVNYVSPGAIATEMTDPERQALLNPIIPAGRSGQPEEVAGMVAYLLSEEAAYITGSGITVDGGLTLGFSANAKG